MTLSIIIISYNTKYLTLQSVESAWRDAQASPKLKGRTEIIVIDNNSSDKSVAELKEEFNSKNIRIIRNKNNVGFAAANNQGIKLAKGKFLLLLNSDTITQQGALETLVKTMESYPLDDSTSTLSSEQHRLDKLGILAPTLLNEDGTVQSQGGQLPNLLSLFFHMTFLDDLPLIGKFLPSTQHTGFRQTEKLRYYTKDQRLIRRDWVGGTAMLIRRELIEEIGDLDSNIFMYGEDIEFCIRARHHHWDVAIHPQAKITHLGSASSSATNALKGELKNYIYIWSKHKPLWQLPLARLIIKLGCVMRIFVFGTILKDRRRRDVYQSILAKI